MYQIEFTPEALDDLNVFKKNEQNEILDGIEQQLRFEPTIETRNRKRMRTNPVAEWELRIGRFRVLYNVEEEVKIVSVEALGIKIGSDLILRGERRKL
ncbi:MAG TPA: type II toxin-antitoxin system RelE/ParE family toxin [Anaerolineales bacterium]|nr:type II toxin-antitoxin system RelE/ParE family toxin [Anaerolineales bacterium]